MLPRAESLLATQSAFQYSVEVMHNAVRKRHRWLSMRQVVELMQLYLLSWFFEDRSDYNKLIAAFAEDLASVQSMPEGCELVERIHLPHLARGYSLCRAVSMVHLMTFIGPWQKRYGMRVEIEPVLNDQELGQYSGRLKEAWIDFQPRI